MKFSYSEETEITSEDRDSIENSIRTIASTPYGTAPFIRDMGVTNYPPKSNSSIEENRYAAETIAQCMKWEDRAKLKEVHFINNETRMVIESGRN